MRTLLALTFSCLFLAACGDSSSTSGSGGGGSGAGGSGAGGSGASSSGGSGGSAGSVDVTVTINEISAKAVDYIELKNTGDAAFDLSDYALAGTLTAGVADVGSAARFPAGTVLDPGGYLIIVGKQDAALGVGPHDICLADGGPSICFYATWGVSDTNGETVYLLTPGNVVATEADYPINAAPAGSSWGRLPDGTGDFALNAPTPGEANAAP